jgi:hypothetical protein
LLFSLSLCFTGWECLRFSSTSVMAFLARLSRSSCSDQHSLMQCRKIDVTAASRTSKRLLIGPLCDARRSGGARDHAGSAASRRAGIRFYITMKHIHDNTSFRFARV